jgi:hypothetical protein
VRKSFRNGEIDVQPNRRAPDQKLAKDVATKTRMTGCSRGIMIMKQGNFVDGFARDAI